MELARILRGSDSIQEIEICIYISRYKAFLLCWMEELERQ